MAPSRWPPAGLTRRRFLTGALRAGALAAAGGGLASGCSAPAGRGALRVVVIGGGYGGATCAKYLRRFDPGVAVTLVEPNSRYAPCPFSNAVLGGMADDAPAPQNYQGLRRRFGIDVVHDAAAKLNPDKRTVTLAGGGVLRYDRLVLSPGISFRWGHIFAGYDETAAVYMPHAWRGGEQVALLESQLAAMRDGGVFAIVVPGLPFRCPPGPYERASLAAHRLKREKPRSKVLILDANEHFSKQDLFEEAWATLYGDLIERVPISGGGLVSDIAPKQRLLRAEAGEFKADVVNVIPFQRAGRLALEHGLTDETGWCPVDHKTFESKLAPGVHVLGDSCLAGAMPKSATSANSQAKVCSLAIIDLLRGREPGAMLYHNTCYSLAAPDYGFSISAMYRYADGGIKQIDKAGGPSPLRAGPAYRADEAAYARGWFAGINADTFS